MSEVSEAAVVRRIRRKLRHEYERLVKARGNTRFQVARYYVVDRNNHIGAGTDDLEDWARELGCLQPDETIR